MNIKEKIVNDYVLSKARDMRNKLINNINSDLETKIVANYPKDILQELLDLRDKLLNTSLEEFLELEFNKELQSYM